jgi:hypothetical protein
MTVFECLCCGATLTVPLRRVALPDHAHQLYHHDLLGVLMDSGTYAVDPEPFGPPWRRWDEVDPAEAEALGVYAPVYAVSEGHRDAAVIAPGDLRGTVFVPDRLDGFCCGLDGRDGPNVACARCGLPVATRIDDCGLWQAVWLDPKAVRAVPGDTGPPEAADWLTLIAQRPGLPPVESHGWWDPRWEAAVAVALTHVLAVSEGTRVTVPDGLLADFFRPALDALLPSVPGKAMALAGPGLPAVVTDIALVPRHPQTGEVWALSGAADVAPLSWDIWAYLAFHRDRRLVPGADAIHKRVHQDDPPPLHPSTFRPDGRVLAETLTRLPEVRRPWLRAIYDRVQERSYSDPF